MVKSTHSFLEDRSRSYLSNFDIINVFLIGRHLFPLHTSIPLNRPFQPNPNFYVSDLPPPHIHLEFTNNIDLESRSLIQNKYKYII